MKVYRNKDGKYLQLIEKSGFAVNQHIIEWTQDINNASVLSFMAYFLRREIPDFDELEEIEVEVTRIVKMIKE